MAARHLPPDFLADTDPSSDVLLHAGCAVVEVYVDDSDPSHRLLWRLRPGLLGAGE
jgi:hypothetical protein